MGVSRPSDYGYERFAIEHFAYKPHCTSAFDDFGHLAIMRKDGQTDAARIPMIDTLANLFAVGINEDLDALLARFNQEELTGEDERALEAFAAAFTGSDGPYEGPYAAIFQYVQLGRSVYRSSLPPGEQFLDAAQSLTSKQAILFCHAFYFVLTGKMAKNVNELKRDPVFRFLFQGLDQIDRMNPIAKKLALQVRKEHLRKKFFPATPYSPSTLLLAKNWFTNTRRFIQKYR